MKLYLLTFICLLLTSCGSLTRSPAEAPATNCTELAKNIFMSETYEADLNQALKARKLITFKEKIIQLQYPRIEWINKAKKSLNNSLRNWNNNRYPAFYLFNDEEVLPLIKRYSENLKKILMNTLPLDDEETTKAYVVITDWAKAFENYKSEMDQLLEERISLQYNLNLLKKVKLSPNESKDIQLTIKRSGELKSEIITLRKDDKNLGLTINKLKAEIADLDGGFIKNGKIKDRIIRQAMLLDLLTVLQREVESNVKNTPAPNELVLKELEKINMLIKNSEYAPSTFGVYKMTDKVFIRELITTSKLDVAYAKIKDPLIKVKNVLSNYFKNKKAGSDEEKIGFFKRIYAKISSVNAKQASIGGGSLVIAGIGFDRYFSFKNKSSTEIKVPTSTEVVDTKVNETIESKQPEVIQSTSAETTESKEPEVIESARGDTASSPNPETSLSASKEINLSEDDAHQQQLDETKKVEQQKSEDISHVIEIQIDELTN